VVDNIEKSWDKWIFHLRDETDETLRVTWWWKTFPKMPDGTPDIAFMESEFNKYPTIHFVPYHFIPYHFVPYHFVPYHFVPYSSICNVHIENSCGQQADVLAP
jgi:hypothetical protein